MEEEEDTAGTFWTMLDEEEGDPSSGHDRHHDTSSLYSLLGSVSLPSSSSHCFHEEEEDFEEEKTSRRRREDLSHTPGRGDSEEEEERPELIGSGGSGGERRRRERRRRTRRNGSEDEEEERKHGPACGFVLDHIRMNERGRDADDEEEEEEDFEETRDGEGMRRNLSTQHHQYTSHLEEEEEQACHTDNPHNKNDHSDIDSKRISAASATLALVLNSDQFMQDLHTNEPPLIRFLCSPVVMYEIVSLLTVVPDAETDSHARKFTSPYYAAEVLCSASPAILSTFLTDPECQGARDLFWSFLRDSQPPVNAVLGGYFSRCWQALIKAHPDETVAYLVSRPNAVEDVAKHLYSRSIADLYKCMLYVDQCIPALIDPEKIIPTLFSLLKHTPETRPYPPPPSRSQRRRKEVEEEDPDREGASSSLSHVVKDERETEEKEGRREEEEETEDLMCGLEGQVCVTLVVRELIYQRLFISYFPTLLRDLTSQPAIQQLIDMITSECDACVSSGVSILTDLLCCTCVGGHPLTGGEGGGTTHENTCTTPSSSSSSSETAVSSSSSSASRGEQEEGVGGEEDAFSSSSLSCATHPLLGGEASTATTTSSTLGGEGMMDRGVSTEEEEEKGKRGGGGEEEDEDPRHVEVIIDLSCRDREERGEEEEKEEEEKEEDEKMEHERKERSETDEGATDETEDEDHKKDSREKKRERASVESEKEKKTEKETGESMTKEKKEKEEGMNDAEEEEGEARREEKKEDGRQESCVEKKKFREEEEQKKEIDTSPREKNRSEGNSVGKQEEEEELERKETPKVKEEDKKKNLESCSSSDEVTLSGVHTPQHLENDSPGLERERKEFQEDLNHLSLSEREGSQEGTQIGEENKKREEEKTKVDVDEAKNLLDREKFPHERSYEEDERKKILSEKEKEEREDGGEQGERPLHLSYEENHLSTPPLQEAAASTFDMNSVFQANEGGEGGGGEEEGREEDCFLENTGEGGGIGGEEENLLNTVFAKEDKKWIAQLEAGEFVELYVHPNLERLMKKLLSSCGFEQDPSWKENQMVFSSLLLQKDRQTRGPSHREKEGQEEEEKIKKKENEEKEEEEGADRKEKKKKTLEKEKNKTSDTPLYQEDRKEKNPHKREEEEQGQPHKDKKEKDAISFSSSSSFSSCTSSSSSPSCFTQSHDHEASLIRSRWRPISPSSSSSHDGAGVPLAELPNGIFPSVGMETLELLTLIKTLLKTNAKKTVKLLLNLGVLDLGVELLFRHPWNSLLHLTVADMLQSLLHRVHEFPEVLSLILLNTRFLPLLFQHFQRKREMREGGGGGGRDEEEEEKEEEEEEAGRTATSSRRGEKKKGGERTAQEDGETMKEKRHEHVEGSEEEEEDGRSKEMRRKGGGRGGEEEERIQGRSLAGEGMVGMKNQKKKKKKKKMAMKKNKKKVRDPSGYTAHLVQVAQLLWLSLDIREVLAYLPPSWQERWDDVVVVELMYYQSILLNDTANLGEEESGCTATLPRLHANAPGLEIIGEREREREQEDQEEEEEHQQVQVEEENGEEREERKDSLSLCVRMTGEKKSTKLVEEYQDHVGRHGRNKKKEPSHFYREYDYPRGGGDEEDENSSSSSSSNLSVSGLSFGANSRNSVQARTAHLEKQEEEERERLHPNQENVERIGVTMVGEEEEEEEEEQGGSAAQPFHLWV